jgi:hypothetical protein
VLEEEQLLFRLFLTDRWLKLYGLTPQ